MHVARSIDADRTVAVLERLAAVRGAPVRQRQPDAARGAVHVRCDNGPELTAHALRDWCRYARTEAAFIEPGALSGVLQRPRA